MRRTLLTTTLTAGLALAGLLAPTACAARPLAAVPSSTSGSAVSTSATSAASATAAGRAEVTDARMRVAGERRTYRVVVPASAARHAPVIVALHGLYGSGPQLEASSGWDEVAKGAGAIVVYPDSYLPGWRSQPGGTHDVTFLTRLVRRVVDEEHADPDRVYLTGHSSGAFMSYRMACDRSGLLAGIGPVAGAPVEDCAEPPGHALPVVAVHGTADTVVPYTGGQPQVPGMPTDGVETPSAHETVERWVTHDGCTDGPGTASPSAGVTTETWTGCTDGVRVRLVSLADWGHAYPATDRGAPLDASPAIWRFLRGARRVT